MKIKDNIHLTYLIECRDKLSEINHWNSLSEERFKKILKYEVNMALYHINRIEFLVKSRFKLKEFRKIFHTLAESIRIYLDS